MSYKSRPDMRGLRPNFLGQCLSPSASSNNLHARHCVLAQRNAAPRSLHWRVIEQR
ncbi:MAG: hypothetical protein WBA10_05420 [Elainellaceae cyanobacterium]